ncbi:hypothetical protein [Hasllibacter sp. MH4015]|uniref:hypothetical protein n=1 Tax=Hasllibacter sp. MH4015 TaxID=2854029 RepID=UPI001CD372E2|nr:hypothetical protein [Hasllibacter sp. MH4015]
MTRAVFAFAATLILSAPVAAQQLDGCSVTPDEYETIVAPLLDGDWTGTNGAGYISGPQMNMPLPPSGAEAVTITYNDDGTIFAAGGDWQAIETRVVNEAMAGDFGITLADDPNLQTRMDFDNLGVAVNCSTDLLPLVSFRGDAVMEGEQIQFEALLYMVNEDLLSGIFHMEFMGHAARRFVTLSR